MPKSKSLMAKSLIRLNERYSERIESLPLRHVFNYLAATPSETPAVQSTKRPSFHEKVRGRSVDGPDHLGMDESRRGTRGALQAVLLGHRGLAARRPVHHRNLGR